MKAIIFDLFGTLVYLARPTNPYQQLFAGAGASAKQLALTTGRSLVHVAKLLDSPLPLWQLAQLEQMALAEAASAELFPDTKEALRAVRGAGCTVLVSSNLAAPYGTAKRLLPDLVDYWSLSYETGFAKPDPRMFLNPAAAFGLEPRDCVVIGDSLGSDGAGAAAAGMQFVHLDRFGRGSAGAARTLLQAVEMAQGRVPR